MKNKRTANLELMNSSAFTIRMFVILISFYKPRESSDNYCGERNSWKMNDHFVDNN
jgi:hypothetical protein